ncbi:MAG TPA: hypothetical protein VIF62_19845 [Labilithrix sp.]
MKRVLALLLACIALAAPRAALADAKELKAQGDRLMDEHKYADAYAVYVRAYEQAHDPALLYNEGRALEAMGEYPDAYDRLDQFEREAPPALRAKAPGVKDLLADLEKRIATVVVITNVKNAQVQIRQKTIAGEGTERTVRTRSGAAAIDVTADGWLPFHQDIDLPGGEKTTVNATLVAKKRDAVLVVRTRPIADLRLDGKPMGPAPLEVHVTPGLHGLDARADGYDDQRVDFQVALGDRRQLDLELQKRPGIASRWWFWTSIAVVVAAGVTTTILLTTERHPDHGTFVTGTVRGP